MGLRKILVTHAEFPSQSLTAEEQLELANSGAIIEHCFTTMHTGKAPWEEVFNSIRAVGAGALAFFSTGIWARPSIRPLPKASRCSRKRCSMRVSRSMRCIAWRAINSAALVWHNDMADQKIFSSSARTQPISSGEQAAPLRSTLRAATVCASSACHLANAAKARARGNSRA